MKDAFEDYWWVLIPLAFFLAAMWRNWLRYLTRRHELEIAGLRAAYARRGEIRVKDGTSGASGA